MKNGDVHMSDACVYTFHLVAPFSAYISLVLVLGLECVVGTSSLRLLVALCRKKFASYERCNGL